MMFTKAELDAMPGITFERAISEITQRKHDLPYNVETVVRDDELEAVLEILSRVRVPT